MESLPLRGLADSPLHRLKRSRSASLLLNLIVGSFVALASIAYSQVVTPVFAPDAADGALPFDVTVTCATPGASIYYTTDGTDPTNLPALLLPANGKVTIGRNLTLKARAYASGMTESAIKSAFYRVTGSISAGGNHAIGLKSNRTLWSWGQQHSGRLGNGSTVDVDLTTPQAVTKFDPTAIAFSDAVAVDAGNAFNLVVDSNGKLWSFGDNSAAQLADNSTADEARGKRVLKANVVHSSALEGNFLGNSVDGAVTAVSGGFKHGLAIEAGKVWGWGERANGRIGDNYIGASSLRKFATPVLQVTTLTQLSNAAQVAAGKNFSLALCSLDSQGRGQVWSWGYNGNGALCLNSTSPAESGTARMAKQSNGSDLNDVVEIAAGLDHAVAIRQDGAGITTAWCWGERLAGRLGDGGATTSANVPYPVQVVKTIGGALTGVVQVSAGPRHTLALTSDGKVWSWGNNADYQLGDGTTTSRNAANTVKLSGGTELTGIVAIAAGGFETYDPTTGAITAVNSYSLALHENGTIYGWGYNGHGQIANGTTAGYGQYATPSPFVVKFSNQTPTVGLSVAATSNIALATHTLTASPADVDGDLDRVEFYESGTFVTTLTAAPWTTTRGSRAAGSYTYQAVAVDSRGARASASQTVTVVNPTVSKVSGDSQTSATNVFLTNPLVVDVRAGAGGSIIAGREVTFTVLNGNGGLSTTSGGATSNSRTVTSNASGQAAIYFKQPTSATYQTQIQVAAAPGPAVTFTATTTAVVGNEFVGHWQLNESSGTDASDASGANNPGIMNGPPYAFWTKGYNWTSGPEVGGLGTQGVWYQGQYGLAVDNTNNRVLPATGQPFSFAMWFRANPLPAGTLYTLFSNETYLQDGLRVGIDTGGFFPSNTPALMVWSTQSGGTFFTRSSSALSYNRWYHLAVTYSGTTGNVYLDGTLIGTNTGTIFGNTNYVKFGSGIGGCFNLDGSIDDVRVYQKELTSTEIATIRDSLTDGDSLLDSWERQHFGDLASAPTDDPDADGLNNLAEYNAGANPNDADSDDDGLNDGFEKNTLLSDPINVDTDGDGLPDGWEYQQGTDILVPDGDSDPDVDDLSNLQEYEFGSDPFDSDSDNDGLIDGWEYADFDNDGMRNGAEVALGLNPLNPDFDGDGFWDGVDLAPSDPSLAASIGPVDPNDHTAPQITLLKP